MFSCQFCEISKEIFLQNISGRLLLTRALGSNCRILLRCYVDNAEFHQGLFYRKHFALLFIVGSKTRNDGRDALVWEFFCSRGGGEMARNKNFL